MRVCVCRRACVHVCARTEKRACERTQANVMILSYVFSLQLTGKEGVKRQLQLLGFVICLSLLSLQSIVARIYTNRTTKLDKIVPP